MPIALSIIKKVYYRIDCGVTTNQQNEFQIYVNIICTNNNILSSLCILLLYFNLYYSFT